MKQWKRLAALSSAIVMAAATLTYFPSDTLQNIRLEISASADETGAETTTEPQVWIEDNLTWTLTADGTLTISGEGAMKDYNSDDNPSPVYNNSDVKKVVIEDGVTSIGNSAFDSCRNLTSVTIPDSVTSIGKDAFEACNSLSSITLSNNITSIGDAAFYDCSNLKSITIPDSVTSIESAVFYNCTSLTSITIPNSVTSIGSYAFSDCSSLTSITIPDSVTSIGTRVFYNCTSLTSITIPDSVTSIGYNVFESCSSLTSITIPKSVTIIGSGVFDKCNNLTVYLESGSTLTSNALGVDESKIVSYWNEDNLTWKLDANGTLTISGTGAMKDYDYDSNPSPVYNNSDVKKIVIEDGVTSIGNFAFHSCSSLPSITIPDSVTSIGNFAFESCNSLSSITLSNNITSIGDFAFHGCPLTSITLPDSVTSIGYAAFHSCSNLKSITIPDSVTSIESAVFYNCTSLKTISLSCKSSLKKSDFGDQSDLVSASHTLKKTEAKAATCSEDGNKEYWTCEYCGKYFLSDDANPETAKAVEQSECMIPAIQHKNATTRGALEPTETAPGYSGDRYCPDCDKVVEKGYTYWIEGNLTWKLYEDGTLNISGTGAMKNYNNTDNLSPVHMNSSVKKIVIEEGVTSIGNAAFSGCISLTNITIPDGVTSIGIMVFYNCTSLTSITIPDSVTSIGNSAFNSCTSLTSITIPDSVTRIGKYAFYDCSSLTSITIPDSVTSIGESVFSFCSSLTSITIPDSVTSIGNSAFYGCSSLTSLTIPNSVTSIGYAAFYDCSSLTSITIPDSVTSIVESAFEDCTNLKTISLSCKSSLKKSDFGEQADLVSYTNQHLLTKTAAKAATCAESGNKEYWTCKHCGKYFLSDDTNPATATAVELSETVIPALKHKNATTRGAVKPTETAPGYSGDRYCPDCNTVLKKGYTYWIEGNLTWKLYEDGTLNISGTGAMKDYDSDDSPATQKKDSVKKVVIEDDVTSIGDYAFWNCSNLTSITIPDSVTIIGNSAFNACSSLTSLTIPNSVTSIEFAAFYACSSLTSITIPDSVTRIGDYAFKNCSNLTSITIPDSVTSIGNSAFYGCSSLKTISLSCKSSLKRSDFGDQANLVSYTSHTLNKTEAKAATCTENGNIEHWTCEHCGKYFLSDDSNPETAKAVELSEITIPNIKHNYDKNGFCKNDDTHYQPATYNEESEKYEISNAGQLYWFAEQVNSGNASLNAVLTTDIVVNETVLAADGSLGADPDTLRMWRSIGDDAENIFKGTFDGQGHTISGLYFSNDSNESDVMCASLFGLSAGIIQNVGLEDSYLNHYNISAGICASNNGQIVNCYNAGTILGYCASGICIENSDNGSIENCYNTGVIRGFGLVAGICNMNAGSMKDCYNNNDIIVMTDSTIIDENDEKSYASGICNINGSSGRIENCYHVGQVSGADVNNNICNLNAGQIENSYYDCNICDKDAITQNESSAVVKNVESKTTKQFASGEVTYLLNGDQSVRAFYQNLAKEKYPTLNQKSKVVMQLEMIYDESFGEDATTNKIYHIAGDTIALETSPDKAYTYQYFVNGKQIEKPNYTLTGNTKMTVKRVPVEIELSEIDTIQLTCQKKMTLDLTEYLKNFADLKPVQFQLDADSKLPDGLKLTEDGMLSGTPKKAATVKTTIVLTAENDSTKEMNLVFIVNAPVTTTTTTITTTTTTKATTTTKPSKTTTTKVTTTTKPNKTTTTKATTTTTTTISSYGDVNLDGMVDILDAVFLNKYLATLIQFSDAQMANADCCQDGVLNDQDTTALMQFIILLIDDLPVQPTEK